MTRPAHDARPRVRPVGWTLLALTLVASACEVPTELPIVDQRWAVPVESTRFGVDDLLPAEVTIAPDSSAFIVDFAPISFATSLGAICPPCAVANGLTVPKPAFADSFGESIDFPADVSAAQVVDGSIVVQVTNGLNFDPLNPSVSGPSGSISVVVRDGVDGDTVAFSTVDGDTVTFAPGAMLNVVMPLLPVALDGALEAEVTLDSPAGDPVTVDASLSISVDASASMVRVSDVAIDVSGQSVDLDPIDFELDDFGEDLQDHVLSGALLLEVVNPFQVGADLQVTIDGPTMVPIQKSFSLVGTAAEAVRIDFTAAEIDAILGESSVTLTGVASVDPAAGIIVVQPADELLIDTTLDLVVRLEG